MVDRDFSVLIWTNFAQCALVYGLHTEWNPGFGRMSSFVPPAGGPTRWGKLSIGS